MTRAIVIGSEGQDGRILFDRLKHDGCDVLGLGRDSVRGDDAKDLRPFDINSREQISELIRRWRPDEIYYLAAVHQASEGPTTADDAALFDRSLSVHATVPIYILDAITRTEHRTRFFYAASSLVFGNVTDECQNERTPIRPRDIYGITKATGMNACRFFRDVHEVHASGGILYNHESPLRKRNFVSQKIIRGALEISRGTRKTLELGDLSARIDWGYAPDYVDAMIRIVRQKTPDDYIVATGEARSVQEFAEITFGLLGLDWQSHVVENRGLLTRRSPTRVGDASKLRERTGWAPQITFPQMIEILLRDAEQHV
jgi:GDPmannose 4,6-dehydratase